MTTRSNIGAFLMMLFVALAMISVANAARTHEKFAQSTYDGAEPEAIIPQEDLSQRVNPSNEPEKVSNEMKNENTMEPASFGYDKAQPDVFMEDTQQMQQQQHFRDYRGVTHPDTRPQGDFVPDAKPWWETQGGRGEPVSKSSSFATYSTTQDGNPGSEDTIPNRYPMGYPTRNEYKPQLSDSDNSFGNAGSQLSTRGTSGSFMSNNNMQQYSQGGGLPQYSSAVPYETTGGGCPAQYWMHNTQRWPAFFNVKTTVGEALGSPAKKVYGETTVMQALQNNRQDGYSFLLRSSATAILNSYGRSQYKLSHVQVMEAFADALASSDKAAKQAASFEEANVSDFADQYNSCN